MSPPTLPLEAQRAAEQGDIVGAIRIAREATGLGLKQAKDMVESHVRAQRGEPQAGGTGLPIAAVAALQEGNLVQAVQHTRRAHGWGLKDSKDAVDQYLASHPATMEQYQSARRRRGGGRWRLVAAALILALAIAVARQLAK